MQDVVSWWCLDEVIWWWSHRIVWRFVICCGVVGRSSSGGVTGRCCHRTSLDDMPCRVHNVCMCVCFSYRVTHRFTWPPFTATSTWSWPWSTRTVCPTVPPIPVHRFCKCIKELFDFFSVTCNATIRSEFWHTHLGCSLWMENRTVTSYGEQGSDILGEDTCVC